MLGSGNKNQWSPVPGAGEDVPKAPSASGKFHQTVGMLTTDIALKTDPKYKRIVELFAEVQTIVYIVRLNCISMCRIQITSMINLLMPGTS